MYLSRTAIVIVLGLTVCGFALPSVGEERINVLTQVERARLAFEHAKADYESAIAAKKLGIISAQAFRSQETAYRQAELDYEQAALLAAGAEQRVSVDSAVKTRTPDGRVNVTVHLSYRIREQLSGADILRSSLSRIGTLTVSLLSENGVIVCVPYEARVYDLHDGESRAIRFELLKDVDVAQVILRYNGQEQHASVYLLHDARGQQVALSAAQPSIDSDAGSTAVFNLVAERLSGRNASFRLAVNGLPADFAYDFTSDTGAHISQIGFTDAVASAKLQLNVHLPRDLPEASIGRPLEFRVECAPLAPDTQPASASSIRLEIVPRGTGRLKIQLSNLFQEARLGQPVVVRARLMNTGTRPVWAVTVKADMPLDWKSQVQPAVLPLLNEGADALVQVTVTPPPDAAVGEYETRLHSTSAAGDHSIQSDEQILRVKLVPRSQGRLTTALFGVVVVLLGGVGFLAIRLSRT